MIVATKMTNIRSGLSRLRRYDVARLRGFFNFPSRHSLYFKKQTSLPLQSIYMQLLRFRQFYRLSSSSHTQVFSRQSPLSSVACLKTPRLYNNNYNYNHNHSRVSSVRGFTHFSSAAMAGVSKACCS